jgi:hypothetical protein
MKPFDWINTGCEPDKETMNPYTTLQELGTIDPKMLDEEKKTTLSRIYKAYDFPSQIRSEMQKLGLRSTGFLNEVIALIEKYAK